MGQVFFDLGMLSAVEVIECSASDLIGSYVGHTGPKTRAQLEKALGKVLFIDEAYRLAEGNFATEAINELVDLLTKPTFIDKIVVVLAGYDRDINHLISVNPGLSSRFPEQITFKNMSPEHCLQILEMDIRRQGIETPELSDTQNQTHKDMLPILKELATLPSWGNARDIKTLAKSIIGSAFKAQIPATEKLATTGEEIIQFTKAMLLERQDRVANVPPNHMSEVGRLPKQCQSPNATAEPPKTSTTLSETAAPPELVPEPEIQPKDQDEATPRDDGVSDETWTQLQADILTANSHPKISDHQIQDQETTLSTSQTTEHQAATNLQTLLETPAKTGAENQELKRQQEDARLRDDAARKARERAKAELERLRLAKARQKREQQIQKKLQQMGVCCAGYAWIKQSGGYRCAGGSHYLSDRQIGI